MNPGTRLGPYEVLSALGAGGMGEVYRARDTKLGRDVALKMLPEAFASDPERLARFQREAQVLASLNHPNIGAIYGIEEGQAGRDGQVSQVGREGREGREGLDGHVGPFLVLELVEGPTLADMLASGFRRQAPGVTLQRDSGSGPEPSAQSLKPRSARDHCLPLDEALPIARQIAEALEAAHDLGIVHRDLKPANIKVRPDGTVKVLDFGLAKAMAQSGQSGGTVGIYRPDRPGSPDRPDLPSPTITSPAALTGSGVILGTAAYMSPEQAKGREADKRSDVWAFGCVLFEMLTGTRPFTGDSVTDTLASVLRSDPDWSRLPSSLPRTTTTLLRRALEKDPSRRIADMAVVRFLLGDAAAELDRATAPVSLPSSKPPERSWLWPAACALLLVALAVAVAGMWRSNPSVSTPTPTTPLVTSLNAPDGTTFDFESLALPALSPDGRRVVFGARSGDGKIQLWLRSLENTTAQPIPGSELGYHPFWSPDSRYVGFATGNRLMKWDITGGPPVMLTTLDSGLRGASWGTAGVIVFAVNNTTGPIFRISAAGGAVTPTTTIEKDQEPRGHRAPWFLPDGHHFLYTASREGDMPIRIGSLDAPNVPGPIVVLAHSPAFYAQGRLLYLRDRTLMTQLFDVTRLTTTGEALPIADQILTFLSPIRHPAVTVSATGILLYQTSGATPSSALAWKDRHGVISSTIRDVAGDVREIQLSPDRESLAVSMVDQTGFRNLWIYELARGQHRRFTFDGGNNYSPVWSHDGRAIYWVAAKSSAGSLFRQSANGSGPAKLVFARPDGINPNSISSDGKALIFAGGTEGASDLWVLPLSDGNLGPAGTPSVFLQNAADEGLGQFSPDGRSVLYVSSDSGEGEVYLASYPGATRERQISSGGGSSPRWRPDGKEIYYVTKTGQLVALEVARHGDSLDVGRPQPLFEGLMAGGRYMYDRTRGYQYDVSADGQKFIVIEPPHNQSSALTIVQNWAAGVKKQ